MVNEAVFKSHCIKIALALIITTTLFSIGCAKRSDGQIRLTCIAPNNTTVVYDTTEHNVHHYYNAGVVEIKDHSTGMLIEYPINSCTTEKPL